jgi:hypothetical protein
LITTRAPARWLSRADGVDDLVRVDRHGVDSGAVPHRAGRAERDDHRLRHQSRVGEQRRLGLVDDERVGEGHHVGRQGGIRGEVDHDAGTRAMALAGHLGHAVERDLELEQHDVAPPRFDLADIELAVRPRDDDDAVLAGGVDRDDGGAGRDALERRDATVDAVVCEAAQVGVTRVVGSHGTDHGDLRARTARGHRLVRALAPRIATGVLPEDGLARLRVPLDHRDEVDVE